MIGSGCRNEISSLSHEIIRVEDKIIDTLAAWFREMLK